jgi:peroxiredoxin
MKKMILAALGILALAACSDKRQFTVEGTIDGAQDSVAYLHRMTVEGAELLDSVVVAQDGSFRFRSAAPEAPDFYVLRIGSQLINFSVDSTETITLNASWPGMASNYEVEGSENSQAIKELTLMLKDLQQRVVAVQRNGSLSQEVFADSLQHMIDAYKQEVSNRYIFSAPQKPQAYFALFQTLGPWNIFDRFDRKDLKVFGAVATSWDTYYPESPRTQNLRSITLKNMRDQRVADARRQQTLDESKIVESGVIDLQLSDNHGQTRTLTELQGKVVLLDFHAFSLPESGARILLMRELYEKFHGQGLEIYQVSVDNDEHLWKQAVANLPWISVRDVYGQASSIYNVQAVPEYFLIDRSNTLQKRSVQMDDLEKEIRALL